MRSTNDTRQKPTVGNLKYGNSLEYQRQIVSENVAFSYSDKMRYDQKIKLISM